MAHTCNVELLIAFVVPLTVGLWAIRLASSARGAPVEHKSAGARTEVQELFGHPVVSLQSVGAKCCTLEIRT
ncbi:MAG: hypothetical protein M3Z25_13235 [Actinomycetota bacterium]|nr:hypothetical protein [Actinomycetota bacterium]